MFVSFGVSRIGDPHYIGLNGLQLINEQREVIPIFPNAIHATPVKDLNSLEDVWKSRGDLGTLTKLIDDVNDTYDDRYVLIPLLYFTSIITH